MQVRVKGLGSKISILVEVAYISLIIDVECLGRPLNGMKSLSHSGTIDLTRFFRLS